MYMCYLSILEDLIFEHISLFGISEFYIHTINLIEFPSLLNHFIDLESISLYGFSDVSHVTQLSHALSESVDKEWS